MKFKFLLFFLIPYTTICISNNTRIETFPLKDVEILSSPFKNAEQLDIEYLLALEPDRLLGPYLREAGLTPKAESYTNWENTGLDGHIGGHYVSALSLMYASAGDQRIKERLDYMLSEWKWVQDANGNGYIGGVPESKKVWDEIYRGDVRAGNFDLNGKWVPLYNIHKVYAGLKDAYVEAGSEEAKEMLIKMTDWAIQLVSQLSDEQIEDMLRSEHGGLNESFADVAAITGDERYLELARQFSHKLILNPLLQGEDNLTGMHANTQIPKIIGYKRIADIEGNQSWDEAARFFWENVVNKRSVTIGGNSASEHFHPIDDFTRMITNREGPETCNTYNMLKLSKMFFATTGETQYMDFYEQALYNHILSSIHPEKGGFVYFTQMRPGHYRVYSQPQTSFWCCVGSGIENHAKYGEMIYSHTDNELYVNLFIPSRLQWKEKNVEIIQENNFPEEAATRLTVNPAKATNFTLKLRYPSWVRKGELKVLVNGKEHVVKEQSGEYVSINRKWKKGDKVEIEMPMYLSAKQMPDKSNYYSLMYGPIVLAAKTTTEDMAGLFADDSRGGHIAHGKLIPMKDAPIIVSEPDEIVSHIKPVAGKPLHFTLTGLYSELYGNEMELMPFYQLYDSRYIIYFPQANGNELEEIKRNIEAEEQERMRLNNVTVDQLTCGQQQPESDHFVQGENTYTGLYDEIHYREGHGWFSYQMQNKENNARYLWVNYCDADRNRHFDVWVNDVMVATVSFNGDTKVLVPVLYELPEEVATESTITVKFVAHDKSMTSKVAEVRLLTTDKY